jgi:hypothetical protein
MMEFPRFPGQGRLIHLNEISMDQIIYGETQSVNYSSRKEKFYTVCEFEKITEEIGFQERIKKVYKPTRLVDWLFKTKKILYVMQK